MNHKFSIITPEHDPANAEFLMELYESIVAQTYDNWEWILFLNGNCELSHISDIIKNNSKVRVIKSDIVMDENNVGNIGMIKNCAFSMGSGDVLVEVDHDDMITENCLYELNRAFQDTDIGFVYSDNAVLKMNGEFFPYDANNGWEHYPYNWKGTELIAMKSFPPTSHSLSYIWYSPDHIRAWRTTIYNELGGHNKTMTVCDDHELCIRTYLHTKMLLISEVLYIYRITGKNTSIDHRNAEIQIKTVELHNQYSVALAERDADIAGLLKVDIGGGINGRPGYLTIDQEGAHMNYDLNKGIPLPDNSVSVINASHVLEHLKDPVKSMSEIHRVLVHGGWAFIEVPSTDGRGAFQDPTHISFWNENSFLYYTDAYLANFIRNKTIRFQNFRCETYFPNEWMQSIHVSVVSAWLVCVKDGPRLPHTLKI